MTKNFVCIIKNFCPLLTFTEKFAPWYIAIEQQIYMVI